MLKIDFAGAQNQHFKHYELALGPGVAVGGPGNERDASEASIPRVQNNISKNIDKCEILVYVIHDIGLPLNTYPTISPATIVIAISITIPIMIFLESQHFDLLLIIKYIHSFSLV